MQEQMRTTTEPKVVNAEDIIEAELRFMSDPSWRLYQAFMEMDDFSIDFEYANRQLGMNKEEHTAVLEGLEKLGMVINRAGKWEIINTTYRINTSHVPLADQLVFHESFINDLAGKLTPERKAEYASGYVASNQKLVSKLQKKILTAFVEFNQESAQHEKDGLYGIGFTVTDLREPQGGK